MTITILTLFPQIFSPVFSSSIVGRAQKKGLLKIRLVNMRDYAKNKHRTVDDKPYGGGVGMVLKVDVVAQAINNSRISSLAKNFKEKIILLDPKGKLFRQQTAGSFSKLDHLILVCGHYEGIDHRIYHFIDESISIGKYVLTGGEIPSMIITDCVTRLIPGVLANKDATENESFGEKIHKEAPQYTRPENYLNYKVPAILLSGNHDKIKQFRKKKTIYYKIQQRNII